MVNPFRRRTVSLPPASKADATPLGHLPQPRLLPSWPKTGTSPLEVALREGLATADLAPHGSFRLGEVKFDQAIFPAQEVENRLQALEAHQAARIDELEARLAVAETELAYSSQPTTHNREVW